MMTKNKTLVCAVIATLWCNLLTSQTLKDAVRQALVTHPDVLLNRAQSLTAKQSIAEAKSAYLPSVDLAAGKGRQWTDSPFTKDLEGDTAITLNRTEFTAELRQNIFSGGGIFGEVQRTRYVYQAQVYKTLAVANDIALKVTEAYLSVQLQHKLVILGEENLTQHKRLLGLIKDRVKAGISREAEVYQALSRVTLAESNLISSQNNYREATIHFNKFVGSWPDKLVKVNVPDQTVLPPTIIEGIQNGLDHHPILKSAYADIHQAKAQYKIAHAAFLPKIDLVLSMGRNHNLDGLVGKNNNNLGAVRLTYNAFKGGGDLARTKKTAYQVQEAFETRNNAIIDVKETVRLSYNALDASIRRSKVLTNYVINTEKTKEAYFEQFKIGQRTLLDLLNTQNEEITAKSEYLQAKNEELFARYRILASMGGLLKFLNGRIPVNVMNDDVSYSYEHIRQLSFADMQKVPQPSLSIAPLDMNQFAEPRMPTKQEVIQQSMPAEFILPERWTILAKCYQNPNDKNITVLKNRLLALGMDAYILHLLRGETYVMVGHYVYKEHAANIMRFLKEETRLNGKTVQFNRLSVCGPGELCV
jgi:adhesin transport system outer membrane protein